MSLKGHAICLIAFLLIFGIINAAFAGGEEPSIPERSIECDALIPADLEPIHGWKVIRAEDRHFISEKIYQGKARWQRRQTLLCRDVSGSKVTAEFVVWQWWWRAGK